MNQQTEKDYIVFSLRMAGYLMQKGMKLKSIKPSKSNPKLDVYIFSDNEYLQKYIELYKAQSKRNN